jgi:hypothetical protein
MDNNGFIDFSTFCCILLHNFKNMILSVEISGVHLNLSSK